MKDMKHLIYISLIISLCSCSDFLEEYSQDTYYVSSYKDLDELLIGDCYLPVQGSNTAASTTNIGYFLPFLADEMEEQNAGLFDDYGNESVLYDVKDKVFGCYTWQQRIGQTPSYSGYISEDDTWTELYRLINVANNILGSVDNVPQSSEEDRLGATRVKGETHFLRAAYYFWLANLYGKPYNKTTATSDLAVPLKTTEKVDDKIYQRNTVQEVYNQVLADLQEAEKCLSQTEKSKSIYRADSTTVHLLESRVYLYMQNWEMAARYADKVLKARSTLTDMNTTAPASGFLSKASKETLFSMGGNDIPCNIAYACQSFRVAKELYDAYEEDDLRKSQWWWTRNDFIGYTKMAHGNRNEEQSIVPERDDYYYYGYSDGYIHNMAEVSDKFLFRTAEAYLNKAEAEAYTDNENEARSALNTLRRNRYATGSNYEVAASGEALVKAIREERRKELALEGHRWFDLRRYMVCEKYPESKKITHNYTYYTGRLDATKVTTHVFVLEANDPAYTLPIPQEVIDFNTGMTNNVRPWRNYTETNPN